MSQSHAPETSSETTSSLRPVRRYDWRVISLLTLFLIAAFALRAHDLAGPPFELDEFWNAELTTGWGSVHETIQGNVIHIPPRATSLEDAPPWYRVPRAMGNITHPPLFSIALRFWREWIADGDFGMRLFGVVTSTLTLLPFFACVRILSGLRAALWATAILAVAAAPVSIAQQVRPYNLLLLLQCLTLWQFLLIRNRGASWPSAILLALSCLACVFTHYFSIPLLAAALLFVLPSLNKTSRARVLLGIGLGAILFLATWSPTILEQRRVMKGAADVWMKEFSDTPVRTTLSRLAEVPLRLITAPPTHSQFIAQVGFVIIPLAAIVAYRRSDLRLWLLMFLSTAAFVAVVDLTLGTRMLGFTRYSLPAAPAVAAIIGSLLSTRHGAMAHALPMATVLGALIALPGVYSKSEPDYRPYAQFMNEHVRSDDIVVFTRQKDHEWHAGILYATWSHYADEAPSRCLVLDGIASEALIEQLKHARRLWVVSQLGAPEVMSWLPGVRATETVEFLHVGQVVRAQVDEVSP